MQGSRVKVARKSAAPEKNSTGSNSNLLNTANLEWLVKCRSQNQQTAFNLLKLIEENFDKLKTNNSLGNCAIAMIAVSFSLWRSVFLADRSGALSQRLDHATSFLRIMINDNAISYVQDKNAREWTFMYYLNNARYRLTSLSEVWEDVLPNFKDRKNISPTRTWEHLQNNLDIAVGNFSNALQNL